MLIDMTGAFAVQQIGLSRKGPFKWVKGPFETRTQTAEFWVRSIGEWWSR